MVMIETATRETILLPDPDVAARRRAALLAAARWWRLEARLSQAVAADADGTGALDPEVPAAG